MCTAPCRKCASQPCRAAVSGAGGQQTENWFFVSVLQHKTVVTLRQLRLFFRSGLLAPQRKGKPAARWGRKASGLGP